MGAFIRSSCSLFKRSAFSSSSSRLPTAVAASVTLVIRVVLRFACNGFGMVVVDTCTTGNHVRSRTTTIEKLHCFWRFKIRFVNLQRFQVLLIWSGLCSSCIGPSERVPLVPGGLFARVRPMPSTIFNRIFIVISLWYFQIWKHKQVYVRISSLFDANLGNGKNMSKSSFGV